MREFAVLDHIYQANRELGADVLIPPGDDMALLRLHADAILAATDQIIDRRHVRYGITPLDLIGRKAITRCLSDVAAMAGIPVGALVSAALPADFPHGDATRLFDAMRATALAYETPLIGGDLASLPSADDPMVCSVTILARPGPAGAITRSGARPGDGIYVTGAVGGSMDDDGNGHHLTFEPRIDVAIELAQRLGGDLHAMVDLSDGLGRDLGHMATASSMRFELDASAIPTNGDLCWTDAIRHGEDYELCFTTSGTVPTCVADVPITRIGRVCDGSPDVIVDGSISISTHGWQHES